MTKRTNFSKFRSLYEVIESLLDTYTHEGVVEILAESYDLELSVSTLRSYLYRYKKQSKELSVATDNSLSQDNAKLEQQKIEQVNEDHNTASSEETTIKNDHGTDNAITKEKVAAAAARFRARQENKRNRSLFDR